MKAILWHIFGTSLFIFLEIGMVFILGTNAHIIDFATFYIVEIAFFYLNAYWLLPKLSKTSFKLIYSITILILWLTVFSIISYIIKNSLLVNNGEEIPKEEIWLNLFLAFLRYVFLFGLSTSLWYARFSVQKLRKSKDQELEIIKNKEIQAQLEVALLRSQLNPHLMFNALHGIHTHIFLKSQETSNIIILLADILEASFKGGNPDNMATLADEISLLKKHIELYRELQPFYLSLNLDIPDSILDKEFPPNLLVTLLENIFKHGDINTEELPALVSIKYVAPQLKIFLSNQIAHIGVGKSHGIGLSNIKKRLDRHFPNQHEFIVTEKEKEKFEVRLNIKI